MFHWPILSAAVGITSNLFFIVLVCLLSWWHLHRPNAHEREYLYDTAKDEDEPQLQQKKRESFTFRGEPDGTIKCLPNHSPGICSI
jgi:seipin